MNSGVILVVARISSTEVAGDPLEFLGSQTRVIVDPRTMTCPVHVLERPASTRSPPLSLSTRFAVPGGLKPRVDVGG